MPYTEFYCQNGGSNLNAGSTNNNTAAYTSNGGNWTQATRVFTVQDGTNPSASVSVGDFASVYVTAGATVAVYIGRVSAVQNATNGTITLAVTTVGSNPANGTGTMTIKVGGAWQGPNAASGFPFTLTNFGALVNTSTNQVRVNLKNDQTYSMTVVFTPNTSSGQGYVVRGYTTSVADGGKATFDGGTSTSSILGGAGPSGTSWIDLIFKTSITSGSGTLVVAGSISQWIRCVFTGSRGLGLQVNTAGTIVIECEVYGNNTANAAGTPGATCSQGAMFLRCIFHDNTGSNTSGLSVTVGGVSVINCISESNGKHGIEVANTTFNGMVMIENCDLYNNTSDGINISSATVSPIWIENCNFIKNGGKGINNASTSVEQWGLSYNCGYGAGTQANGSSDTLGNIVQTGTVTYTSGLTPWTDPANGDFRISLGLAIGTGRGAFQQTASGYAGTAGYPDIGAAQTTLLDSGIGGVGGG